MIRAFVSDAQLSHGVLRAWLLPGGVGTGLLALSVIVSARLAELASWAAISGKSKGQADRGQQ